MLLYINTRGQESPWPQPEASPLKKLDYTKPQVSSQQIRLGVYGDYGNDGRDSVSPFMPIPLPGGHKTDRNIAT